MGIEGNEALLLQRHGSFCWVSLAVNALHVKFLLLKVLKILSDSVDFISTANFQSLTTALAPSFYAVDDLFLCISPMTVGCIYHDCGLMRLL